MTHLRSGSDLQNRNIVPYPGRIDYRDPRAASSLIRLVVVELPDRDITPNAIISNIRSAYPNAQVLFTAPQPAMDATRVGNGNEAHMYGLGTLAAQASTPPDDTLKPALGACEVPQVPAKAKRRFSPRQAQVAECIVRGLSNKGIARELDLSESTVKVYVVAIYKVLEVHSRAGAISTILNSTELRQELGV